MWIAATAGGLIALGSTASGVGIGAAGAAEPVGAWVRTCHEGLTLGHPPELTLRRGAERPGSTEVVERARWTARGTRWFLVLLDHEMPAGEPLEEWASDLGGDLQRTRLPGGQPALRRTALFEAVYERSLFFRVAPAGRLVELRLVVAGLTNWMEPEAKVEPRYRAPVRVFDRMVRSILVAPCPDDDARGR